MSPFPFPVATPAQGWFGCGAHARPEGPIKETVQSGALLFLELQEEFVIDADSRAHEGITAIVTIARKEWRPEWSGHRILS
ncbi:MAG TPA: hypothetical protein VFG71_03650, partial [Nitrospiraceae bacterium]|nr:hypothetical protein [Nitrospiraceae bacterium]